MVKKAEEVVIVKIQQSLGSFDKGKSILVYDKARLLFFESKDPGIVLPLVEKLGEEPKKYFKAKIEGQQLKVFDEIKNQDW